MKHFSWMKYLAFICMGMASHLAAEPQAAPVWTESPSDPVFAPFASESMPDDYFPCVLFNKNQFNNHGDAVYYKMWHQAPNGIGLSYSPDGAQWFFQSTVVVDDHAFHPTVIYDKNGFGGGSYHYKMWYWTGNSATIPPSLSIKVSMSADGVNWTVPADATQDDDFFLSDVTDKNTEFHQFLGFGTVIYNPNATSKKNKPMTYPYVAYYDTSTKGGPAFDTQTSVALAYSSDGVHWKRYGQDPVLSPSGKKKDWDGKFIYRASVGKFLPDGKYHMFYSGSNDNPNDGLFYAQGIGYAVSQDGIEWKKNKQPLFGNDDAVYWRQDHILSPTVAAVSQAQNTLLQMWFSGGKSSSRGVPTDMKIGYATSVQ